MHAKLSRTGLRFFAHAAQSPECGLAGESMAHHQLKSELATAAVAAGAQAELEVPAANHSWRADVLASDPTGSWRIALEAQLSPITASDLRARTERMRTDQVGVCWFSDRPRPPWLGTVPSIRLARTDSDRQLLVAEGLYRFKLRWQPVRNIALATFLGWVFAGNAVPHHTQRPWRRPHRQTAWIWTAPQYIRAENAQIADDERRQHLVEQQQQLRRERIDEHNTTSRAQALQDATAVENAARTRADAQSRRGTVLSRRSVVGHAIALLAEQYDIEAHVGYSVHNRRLYAWGIPLMNPDGVPVAVVDPIPAALRGEAFRLLAGLLLLFPTTTIRDQFLTTMRKQKRQPVDGYQTDVCTTPPEIPQSDPTSDQ